MMSSWLRYEYDGLNLLRIDERYDGDSPVDSIDENDPWSPMNVFVHAPGQIGQIVECHSYDQGVLSDRYWYMYDALGNVVATVDSYGNTTHWEQDAFGQAVPGSMPWEPMSSSAPKEHLTGKMYDDVTGLYYFHARWYDPEVGRFVSRDPVTLQPDYGMGLNNPLSLVDVNGQSFESVESMSYVVTHGDIGCLAATACIQACGFGLEDRIREKLIQSVGTSSRTSWILEDSSAKNALLSLGSFFMTHHISFFLFREYDSSPYCDPIQGIECFIRDNGPDPGIFPLLVAQKVGIPHGWKVGRCPKKWSATITDSRGTFTISF